jgi:DNA-binding transcriptional ArsR family regulator
MADTVDPFEQIQDVFRTLGDANRLRIVSYIGRDTRAVSEIVSATGLSQPLVSHHLRVLREQRILVTRREGPFIFYQLKDPRLFEALRLLSEIGEVEMRQGLAGRSRRRGPPSCRVPFWRKPGGA